MAIEGKSKNKCQIKNNYESGHVYFYVIMRHGCIFGSKFTLQECKITKDEYVYGVRGVSWMTNLFKCNSTCSQCATLQIKTKWINVKTCLAKWFWHNNFAQFVNASKSQLWKSSLH